MLAIISKSPRTVSKYNLCSSPDHRTVIPHCKTERPSARPEGPVFQPRALCSQQGVTGGALAALQLRQNLVLPCKIPRHSCINVSLGVAVLRSCQTSLWGWHVPSGDPRSHTGVAGMNGSDRVWVVSHSWGSFHGSLLTGIP